MDKISKQPTVAGFQFLGGTLTIPAYEAVKDAFVRIETERTTSLFRLSPFLPQEMADRCRNMIDHRASVKRISLRVLLGITAIALIDMPYLLYKISKNEDPGKLPLFTLIGAGMFAEIPVDASSVVRDLNRDIEVESHCYDWNPLLLPAPEPKPVVVDVVPEPTQERVNIRTMHGFTSPGQKIEVFGLTLLLGAAMLAYDAATAAFSVFARRPEPQNDTVI